jgi:hypothetical protein
MAGEKYVAPFGYANTEDVAARRRELANEAIEQREIAQIEATGDRKETTQDVYGGIIEEGRSKFPVTEPDTVTGMDLAARSDDSNAGLSVQVTQDVYGHWSRKARKSEVAKLADAFTL